MEHQESTLYYLFLSEYSKQMYKTVVAVVSSAVTAATTPDIGTK